MFVGRFTASANLPGFVKIRTGVNVIQETDIHDFTCLIVSPSV
jgi:hypothetical protein